MICTQCRHELAAGDRYCGACGAPQEQGAAQPLAEPEAGAIPGTTTHRRRVRRHRRVSRRRRHVHPDRVGRLFHRARSDHRRHHRLPAGLARDAGALCAGCADSAQPAALSFGRRSKDRRRLWRPRGIFRSRFNADPSVVGGTGGHSRRLCGRTGGVSHRLGDHAGSRRRNTRGEADRSRTPDAIARPFRSASRCPLLHGRRCGAVATRRVTAGSPSPRRNFLALHTSAHSTIESFRKPNSGGRYLTLSDPVGVARGYEQYFGLVESPFGLTPNRRFLFKSESHYGSL